MPQFGGKRCRKHQWDRRDGKAPKPIGSNAQIKPKKKKVSEGPTQVDVFNQMLTDGPLVSFISGLPITPFDMRNYACCLHVLSKALNKYPLYKAYPPNIVLATYDEHTLFDKGTDEQRERYAKEQMKDGVVVDWQKLYDLKEELKSRYPKLD